MSTYKLNQYNNFHDCFFSSVMTICDYLETDHCKKGLALLYLYSISSQPPIGLNIQKKLNNIVELLNISGIHYIACTFQKNLSEALIRDINSGRPVILCIDCFYDSMSQLSFGRIHAKHYIIVTDYDLKDKSFRVIQHDYANENQYAYRKISFGELEKCYYGGNLHFKDKNATYFWFYKANPEEKLYTKRISHHMLFSEYKHALEALEQFLQFFIVCVTEKIAWEHMEPFVKSYKEILQVKNEIALFYREQFGDLHHLTKLTMKIASLWSIAYQIAADHKSIHDDFKESIMNIVSRERELYAEIEKNFLLA